MAPIRSHLVAVHDVEPPLLPRFHQYIGKRTALGRRNNHASRSEVGIGAVQARRVVRREIIRRCDLAGRRQRQLHQAVSKIDTGRRRRRRIRHHVAGHRIIAIPGSHKNSAISGRIRRQTRARRPQPASDSIRRRAPRARGRQRRSFVAQNPAVPWPVITVRGKAHVHESVDQQKSRPLIFPLRIESQTPAGASTARSGHGRAHRDRPAEFLCSRSDVDRVQAQKIRARFQRLAHDIQSIGGVIDDRRSSNPDFRNDVARTHVAIGHGRTAIHDEAYLPQRSPARIRIERIKAVVFRSHVQHVMHALAGDRDSRHIQRLRIDVAIHWQREELPERRRIDVCCGQNCFASVLSRAAVVVVLRQNRRLRPQTRRAEETQSEPNQPALVFHSGTIFWHIRELARCSGTEEFHVRSLTQKDSDFGSVQMFRKAGCRNLAWQHKNASGIFPPR